MTITITPVRVLTDHAVQPHQPWRSGQAMWHGPSTRRVDRMSITRQTLDDHLPDTLLTLPPGGQRRCLVLDGQRKPVTRARQFSAGALADWSWPGADDVVLLVVELVANAMLHADGPQDLVLHATDTRLRVEVTDASRTAPAPREPRQPATPGGHGLHIVSTISDGWGTSPHPSGKTVWAEIDAPRP
ncbi:ATP-binding protein [Kitasatospora sp. NPDC101801]|uniref:ATP-binding protein n=1 Tax=Kitasatospora sp. NPDC101801 TaxID=3364103 RepID=UPI00380B9ADF